MRYMSDDYSEILTEILLELTLKIGSETEYDKIIKTTITQWLRRLNCTLGAVIQVESNDLTVEAIIPTYLKNTEVNPTLKETLLSKNNEFFTELVIEDQYVYCYSLGNDRSFVFYRNSQLTRIQCNEIFPVVQFFAKNLDSAREREHRFRIELQLDKEKRLLDTVINNLPYSIYVKDRSLNKILTNRADVEFLGFDSQEDVLGKSDNDIFSKEVAADSNKIENQILESGKSILDREEKIKKENGDLIWIRTSKFPLKNSQNDIVGILGIGRNVTNEKFVQQQIKRLSLVASQSTNGVIITDVNGKVEWINDGFTRLTGYSLEEIIGRSPGELLQGPETDPKMIEIMSKSIKRKESFDVELINYSKDGTPYNIKVACNPLRDENGVVTGFMAIESDITERVRNKEALIRAKLVAEKAKDAEKAFLANMSHEIRTPMNAIIGMTSLLADTPLNEEQTEYVTNLDLSSKFLLSLISDVLDLAKIEAGRVELKQEDFDLQALLKNVESSFSLKAAAKNVKVVLNVDDAVPDQICSDKILLQQVLNNLMSNAEKFTQHGSIQLTVKLQSPNQIQFSVIDSGIGISKDNQEKLFQKFNQFGKNENSLNKGSGLGLCITKEIIELFGGEIEVESELEKGSVFSFNLPFKLATIPALQSASSVKKSSTENMTFDHIKKILIAEDNKLNQLYISRLLEKMNIDFDMVENGLLAFEHASQNEYTVILMDIQMPVMNGYESVAKIRHSSGPSKDTPIIALTASALLEDRQKAFEIGVSDYLSKPFTPIQLKEKLNLLKNKV